MPSSRHGRRGLTLVAAATVSAQPGSTSREQPASGASFVSIDARSRSAFLRLDGCVAEAMPAGEGA